MNISTSHPFASQLIPSDRFERICRDPTPPPLSQSVIQNKRNGPSSSKSQRERERSSTPKSFLQKARLQAERKKKEFPREDAWSPTGCEGDSSLTLSRIPLVFFSS